MRVLGHVASNEGVGEFESLLVKQVAKKEGLVSSIMPPTTLCI